MFVIFANTLLRNKVGKELKKSNINCIEKFKLEDDVKRKKAYMRRLNQNIRKRTSAMLSYNSVRAEDVAELLDLIDARLEIQGIDKEEVDVIRKKLNDEYGGYNKRYYTTSDIEVPAKSGFTEYIMNYQINVQEDKE